MINKIFLTAAISSIIIFTACSNKDYQLPVAKDNMQNDVIKRTLGPNIKGDSIYFAYAIALPASKGKIVSANVEATIPGDTKTYIDNKSYYTNPVGNSDVGITVASASVTNGNNTSIQLTKDTNAVTFRYYYFIPEAAKGKKVSFTFTAKADNGNTVSYTMGPYDISKMDMVKNLTVSNNNKMYVSLTDMAVYDAAEAAANAAKVDLVYLFRNQTPLLFNHAIVSPTAEAKYLPSVTLPAGVKNDTKLIKVFGLNDFNLSTISSTFYFAVDDIDFISKNYNTATNYAVDLKKESGLWLETSDKKYRAFLYVNAVNANGTASVGIKRFAM